jgi:glutamate dehydrogenase
MALDVKTAENGFIAQVQKLLGERSEAATFAALLYAGSARNELASLPRDWLAAEARAAFEFFKERPKGQHKIRVRRVATVAGRPAASVMEIVNDDMPFLVDSTVGELQARGLPVLLLLHPMFKIERDASGRLRSLLGPGDRNWNDGRQESFIAVHLPPLSEAAAQDLRKTMSDVLGEVRLAVSDWHPMLERVRRAIRDLEKAPASVPSALREESIAFLQWLESGNFTFLGVREFELAGNPQTGNLVPMPSTGLGLFRDPNLQVLRRGSELVAMTPEVRRFFFASSPLIITKTDVISRVHRRVHMDYVGVKIYGDGTPSGELRLIGLFTSQAYVRSPTEIPFLRHKVGRVIEAFGYPPASHDGKALLNVLETFPRDELFQIGARRLQEWCEGILDLEIRPRVRVFARVDRFERFVSALVYVPRDRFSTKVRERIAELLAESYAGRVAAFYPYFREGPLVRVHFTVARGEGPAPKVDTAELERRIADVVRTWDDRLADAIAGSGGDAEALQRKYGGAFPAAYADTFLAARALDDIRRIERLAPDRPVAIEFYREENLPLSCVKAAVYRLGAPMRLSERVPVLENLGFLAIDERSYRIAPRFADGVREVTLHDMVLQTSDGAPIDPAAHAARLEACFLAVIGGAADNDAFNRLIIAAGAEWREVAALRCYAAYLRQLGAPFGLAYIAHTLNRHAGIVRDILELFHLRFDPDRQLSLEVRAAAAQQILRRIEGALGPVPSLDEDRILRLVLNLVRATVRTNFYQRNARGEPPETIAFKFDAKAVEVSPQPRPFREIWVYAPRLEGVHLRFAPIARGGIRWSDRPTDFRSEVLSLAKAQLVKNAVIVPSGAKGGFVPKRLPRAGSRDEVMREGLASYRTFIATLLDLTDNIEGGRVVAPERVVRHDGDDPYLVVAADKGTAAFSDAANELSAAHGFWLGDAFASGGSSGYDHKKMGITARGAWECVKRHFRELDRDIEVEPFTVVGIGDMSGDVFGNGMVLAPTIRLIAAFDHRDIFIDPDPDPTASFAERKRLFELPRSSWQDYDRTKISKGGGVFSRAAKAIPVSAEMKSLLAVQADSLTPAELIRAVLKAKTDLLWFGGIGTFVRSSTETDSDVGDRANDQLRITAAELGASVVAEGANLGLTQRARIEFALRGGRINTDFIDNSAGVNSSDQEVNIKIALGPATRTGRLAAEARKALLASMTEDVAAACLRNNYQQSLALSLAERRSVRELPDYVRLMRTLEQKRLLDRALEALPSDAELEERRRARRGLTRPELAVLLSYAKIALFHELLDSQVPDEPQLESWLTSYFPPLLRERFLEDIKHHRLRREIIATGLTNAIVNRGGPGMAVRAADESGRSPAEVAYGYVAARDVFRLPQLWRRIDALDGKLAGSVQLDLYEATQELLRGAAIWFLRDAAALGDLAGTVTRHAAGVEALRPALDAIVSSALRARVTERAGRLCQAGVPTDLARDIARLELLAHSPSIVKIAGDMGLAAVETARVFFALGEHLKIDNLLAKTASVPRADYYDHLAVGQALARIADAQSALTREVLRAPGSAGDVSAWIARRGARLARVQASLDEIVADPTLTISRLLLAAGQLGDLAGQR